MLALAMDALHAHKCDAELLNDVFDEFVDKTHSIRKSNSLSLRTESVMRYSL